VNMDTFADKAPLKNGPADMERDRSGGSPIDTFADNVPLKGVTPMDSYSGSANQETFGGKVPLDRTPHRGWESGSTPIFKQTPPNKKG